MRRVRGETTIRTLFPIPDSDSRSRFPIPTISARRITTPNPNPMLELIGFDADDTLWHSEGYYQRHTPNSSASLAAISTWPMRAARAVLATERRN